MNKKYFYSIAAIIGLQYIMLCAMGNKDDFKSDKLSLPGFTDGDVSSLHQNNEETYDQINLNQNNLNTEPPLKKQKIEKNQIKEEEKCPHCSCLRGDLKNMQWFDHKNFYCDKNPDCVQIICQTCNNKDDFRNWNHYTSHCNTKQHGTLTREQMIAFVTGLKKTNQSQKELSLNQNNFIKELLEQNLNLDEFFHENGNKEQWSLLNNINQYQQFPEQDDIVFFDVPTDSNGVVQQLSLDKNNLNEELPLKKQKIEKNQIKEEEKCPHCSCLRGEQQNMQWFDHKNFYCDKNPDRVQIICQTCNNKDDFRNWNHYTSHCNTKQHGTLTREQMIAFVTGLKKTNQWQKLVSDKKNEKVCPHCSCLRGEQQNMQWFDHKNFYCDKNPDRVQIICQTCNNKDDFRDWNHYTSHCNTKQHETLTREQMIAFVTELKKKNQWPPQFVLDEKNQIKEEEKCPYCSCLRGEQQNMEWFEHQNFCCDKNPDRVQIICPTCKKNDFKNWGNYRSHCTNKRHTKLSQKEMIELVASLKKMNQ